MIENIFTATPAEIDGEIARLQGQVAPIESGRQAAARTIRSEHATEDRMAEASCRMQELGEKAHVLYGLIAALEAEYVRRGRWTRVYVVDNSNGHTHRSTHCPTTYASTDFYWFPEHSGKSDDEIVELAGGLACLVCFPHHRAEIEQGRPGRLETPNQASAREQREEQAAKAAAKKADAESKGIADTDGSPLLDEDGCVIKTLRTAQIKAAQALEQSGLDAIYADQAEDDPKHAAQLTEMSRRDREYAVRLIKAVAAKQDRSLAEVLDETAAKADKKLAPARKDEAARKEAGKTAAEWYAARR